MLATSIPQLIREKDKNITVKSTLCGGKLRELPAARAGKSDLKNHWKTVKPHIQGTAREAVETG